MLTISFSLQCSVSYSILYSAIVSGIKVYSNA